MGVVGVKSNLGYNSKSNLVDCLNLKSGKGKTRLIFKAPSRGLIGYQNQFLTETKKCNKYCKISMRKFH